MKHNEEAPRTPTTETFYSSLFIVPTDHADNWDQDGFDDREPAGARLQQQRRGAAAELKSVAEAGDIRRRGG